MFVIGLDTSGLVGSVALLCDGELLGERSLGEAGRRHAQSLVLELHELLKSHGAKPRDVKAVAVSKGPGSFTGLRVGLVCAKTFAYATGCQFVAVNTFEAIADNCPTQVRDVWIVEN
ncbi:MAG: tRNA (adenosine(37)-N6)-threonylcarbamoyltransferase complex dimerization subunit type 1 TsaB, partial [Candidatus Saccharimonas sp.]|nr:tRNA (adenosine(37)-N6)-threonylcarbamoyltransferase complex dimerization subunit type 1 TsaB [Planctomycetaceae bacterium]